ncbi:MAG: zinc finger MYND domain-containing protein [Chlamydiales bacterium]
MACSDIGMSSSCQYGRVGSRADSSGFIQDFIHGFMKDQKSADSHLDLENRMNACFRERYPHLLLKFNVEEVHGSAKRYSIITTKHPDAKNLKCGKCTKKFSGTLKKCQKCNVAAYCSRTCRKEDKAHRTQCRILGQLEETNDFINRRRVQMVLEKQRLVQLAQSIRASIKKECENTIIFIEKIREQQQQLSQFIALVKEKNCEMKEDLLKEIDALKESLIQLNVCLDQIRVMNVDIQNQPLTGFQGDEIYLPQLNNLVEKGINLEEKEEKSYALLRQLTAKSGDEALIELLRKIEESLPGGRRFASLQPVIQNG